MLKTMLKFTWRHIAIILFASMVFCTQQARADVTADAQLVLTITVNDVFLIEPDDTGISALDFDIEISGVGVNTSLFGGGSPSNAPGALGTHSESEVVLFNGADVSAGDFNAFEVGLFPGDTIVITQNVEATATSPDSLFFSQVTSEISLSFDSFGGDDQRFLFDFDVAADLTGNFDLTMPGSALALAQGDEILAVAESTVTGDPVDFILFSGELDNYYDIFELTSTLGSTSLNQSSTPLNIPVEFSPGDNQHTITFFSSLLVNASTDAIPEPSSSLLLISSCLTLGTACRKS